MKVRLLRPGLGAVLLLATPTAVFANLVPWLILSATLIFAAGIFGAGGTLVLIFSHYRWVPEAFLSELGLFLKVPDLPAQGWL